MKQDGKLRGKVVWITGASSGIGEQLCHACAREGADLIISARSKTKLAGVREQVLVHGVRIAVLAFDLEKLDTLPNKVTEALAIYGRVDVLINNAGIALKDWVTATKLEVDRKVMDINYFGPLCLTKGILPHMLERGSGQLVVISSLSGKYGVPKISSYAASKHALHGFYETLRSEIVNSGVFITIIIPGIIQTEITAHALTGDGGNFGKVDKTFQRAYPADKAARKIVRAFLAKQEEVFVGGTEGITLLINRISPWFLRRFIRNHPIKRLRKLKEFFSFKKPSGA
ncbi:SDR family oxidoreductase [Lewinella sp. W8]|uniref:SDR family oxidoreductase n=1 Tax=Lewinella sp. W8 TaxID=2528208 RepID=UPI001565CC1F|nr:SDR family oxidoreductase [Lewinella sp. W8]